MSISVFQCNLLMAAIDSGGYFRTIGCAGDDGEITCNRPYINSRPGPDTRNYPFLPDQRDIRRIRAQMGLRPCGEISSASAS